MLPEIKRAFIKHKNNKPYYYIRNYLRLYLPSLYNEFLLTRKMKSFSKIDISKIKYRIDYYNKLSENTFLSSGAISIDDFKLKDHRKVYFFDTFEYLRYFPGNMKFSPLFGDINYSPDFPVLTKSRPVYGNNKYSILLNLNKIRHFNFINDKNSFRDKKNMLVGRSKARQAHRLQFLEMYHNHPLCNIGQVNRDINLQYLAPRLTIEEHLRYKFILCLEGNDVASNLKWVMSSNSIAVMPKPKFETWFMEGTLIPDYHYICIKDDYSDLESKLTWFIDNPDKCLSIIENAHTYIEQFRNPVIEEYISCCVLEKYFKMTNQAQCSFVDQNNWSYI